MLHVHILLAAPLSAGHMTQPGTDKHEGGITVWERMRRLPILPLSADFFFRALFLFAKFS